MNKKTIVFYVLAILFLLSGFSGGFDMFIGGAVFAVVFFLLGRKYATPKNIPTEVPTTSTPVVPAEPSPYIFEEIKVAGVTFKNGKKSRQSILRAIRFRDEPYTDELFLALKHYLYEDNDAYYVTVNEEPIGSIPADKVAYIKSLLENDKIVGLTYIDVYGGGRDEDGYSRSYGAKITLKIKNS